MNAQTSLGPEQAGQTQQENNNTKILQSSVETNTSYFIYVNFRQISLKREYNMFPFAFPRISLCIPSVSEIYIGFMQSAA